MSTRTLGAVSIFCAARFIAACSAGNVGTGPDTGSRGDAGDAIVRDQSSGDVGGPMDGGTTDSQPASDGADVPPDTLATFCMGTGPVVQVGDADGGAITNGCVGSIAERLFASAMCSCTDANVGGYLRTRSWDSRMGSMTTVSVGAPVGIDRTYTSGGDTDIGGTYTDTGTTSTRFAGYLKVGGDLMFNGDLSAVGYINVTRDGWVNGNINTLGLITIGRNLHQPSGHTLSAFHTIGGTTSGAAFTIPQPCDCAPADLLDVNGIVADAHVHNDNAAIPLDAGLLANVVGIGVDITLPCGRFYVDSIGGLGGITIHVPGRTALFVGGDVNAIGALNVQMGPMGELDLFIAGNLVSIGAGSFGNRSRPAATRIYVGGAGDVLLAGASGFVGNVYAPRARITAGGATTVYGSIFGRLIDMPGYLVVNYDRAILGVGHDCPMLPPPGTCTTCGPSSCPMRQACVGGACGACHADGDCCAPLVCYPDGTCGPLIG